MCSLPYLHELGPGYFQAETLQLKIQRILPGCLLDAPFGLVRCRPSHSICIRGLSNVMDLSSSLFFPPCARCLTAASGELLIYLCLSPSHTGLSQLLTGLASSSAAQRAGTKNCLLIGCRHSLYKDLSSTILLMTRAGQNSPRGLNLGLGEVPIWVIYTIQQCS